MKFLVEKTEVLSGTVSIPGNKSGTARALVLGSVAEGETTINNPLNNIDSFSIIKMLEAIGAKIDYSDPVCWKVKGTGGKFHVPSQALDAENSGTGYYTLTSIASTIEGKSVMTGDYQICYRPAAPLVAALNAMGAKCISTRDNGLAPLLIEGKLTGGTAVMPGYNSQWFSPGLLIATALSKNGGEIIIEGDPLEQSYINMSMGMMAKVGLKVEHENYQKYIIKGNQKATATTFDIPGDWGSSGYPMFATAITNSKATFLNLNQEDYAGERKFVEILQKAGAKVEVLENGVRVEGTGTLIGQEIDCSTTPDAVPILAVYGCCAEGKTVLKNIQAARYKETDRAKIIMTELQKMGGKFEETEDSLTIYKSDLKGTFIDGHHDHRIVMASSVAGLVADGPTIISDAEYVGVSFPGYYELMKTMGANITRLNEF